MCTVEELQNDRRLKIKMTSMRYFLTFHRDTSLQFIPLSPVLLDIHVKWSNVQRSVCRNVYKSVSPNTCGWHLILSHSLLLTACGPVPLVPNANILPGLHILGTIRHYECLPGFVPNNPPEIECLPDAQWSPVGFACVGKCYRHFVYNVVVDCHIPD